MQAGLDLNDEAAVALLQYRVSPVMPIMIMEGEQKGLVMEGHPLVDVWMERPSGELGAVVGAAQGQQGTHSSNKFADKRPPAACCTCPRCNFVTHLAMHACYARAGHATQPGQPTPVRRHGPCTPAGDKRAAHELVVTGDFLADCDAQQTLQQFFLPAAEAYNADPSDTLLAALAVAVDTNYIGRIGPSSAKLELHAAAAVPACLSMGYLQDSSGRRVTFHASRTEGAQRRQQDGRAVILKGYPPDTETDAIEAFLQKGALPTQHRMGHPTKPLHTGLGVPCSAALLSYLHAWGSMTHLPHGNCNCYAWLTGSPRCARHKHCPSLQCPDGTPAPTLPCRPPADLPPGVRLLAFDNGKKCEVVSRPGGRVAVRVSPADAASQFRLLELGMRHSLYFGPHLLEASSDRASNLGACQPRNEWQMRAAKSAVDTGMRFSEARRRAEQQGGGSAAGSEAVLAKLGQLESKVDSIAGNTGALRQQGTQQVELLQQNLAAVTEMRDTSQAQLTEMRLLRTEQASHAAQHAARFDSLEASIDGTQSVLNTAVEVMVGTAADVGELKGTAAKQAEAMNKMNALLAARRQASAARAQQAEQQVALRPQQAAERQEPAGRQPVAGRKAQLAAAQSSPRAGNSGQPAAKKAARTPGEGGATGGNLASALAAADEDAAEAMQTSPGKVKSGPGCAWTACFAGASALCGTRKEWDTGQLPTQQLPSLGRPAQWRPASSLCVAHLARRRTRAAGRPTPPPSSERRHTTGGQPLRTLPPSGLPTELADSNAVASTAAHHSTPVLHNACNQQPQSNLLQPAATTELAPLPAGPFISPLILSPPNRPARVPGAEPAQRCVTSPLPLCRNHGNPPTLLLCRGSGDSSSSQPFTAPSMLVLQTLSNPSQLCWHCICSMRPPAVPALLAAYTGRQWGESNGPAACMAQPVNRTAASCSVTSQTGEQMRGQTAPLVTPVAQPWWDSSAFALLRAWLLIMAGDVELNPGPPNSRAGDSAGWLGVSDTTAARLLRLLRSVAAKLGALPIDLSAEQHLGRPSHGWDHPAMQVLATRIDTMLPAVPSRQGLTAADVAHLPNSIGFEGQRTDSFPDAQPFSHSLGLPMVKEVAADGNCNPHSILLGVTGEQHTGVTALRLRILLELIAHSRTYYARYDPRLIEINYPEDEFERLATPRGWVSRAASAAAATLLQTPILLYNPGLQVMPGRDMQSAYIPPLYVREEYADKVPILQIWAMGGRVASTDWNPTHYEVGFLHTKEQYFMLLDPTHTLYLPAHYREHRDPRLPWSSRASPALSSLPHDQQSIVQEALRAAELALPATRVRKPTATRRGTRRTAGRSPQEGDAAAAAADAIAAAAANGATGAAQHKRNWQEMAEPDRPTGLSKLRKAEIQVPGRNKRWDGTAVRPQAAPLGPPRRGRPAAPKKRKQHNLQGQKLTIRSTRKASASLPESPQENNTQQTAQEAPKRRQLSIKEAIAMAEGKAHTKIARRLRQPSIKEAMATTMTRAQAGQPLLAAEQRAARLTASPPQRAAAAARLKRKQATHQTGAEPPAEPSPSESAAAQAVTAAAGTPEGHLVVHTYNPMGGTTTESVIAMLAVRNPDVLVLPEVKISSRRQRKNLYRRLLGAGYVLAYSLLPGGSLLSSNGREGRYKAGVIVATAKRHTHHNSLHRPDMSPTETRSTDLSGFVSHVQLTPPGGRPLDVLGIYRPGDDREKRRQVDQYIQDTARSCRLHGRTLIVAGDLNATIRDADRSTGTVCDSDREWRQLAQTIQLVPVGGLPPDPSTARETTYRQHILDGEPVASAIDDVLVCLPTLPGWEEGEHAWQPVECTVLTAGGNGDHEPLEAKLPCTSLGYIAPPPQVAVPFRSRRKFCAFNKDELQRYKDAVEAELGAEVQNFEAAARGAADLLTAAHRAAVATTGDPQAYQVAFTAEAQRLGVPANIVEELSSQLTNLLGRTLELAWQHCSNYDTTDKRHLPRGVGRKIKKLDTHTCLHKQALRVAGQVPAQDAEALDEDAVVHLLHTAMEKAVDGNGQAGVEPSGEAADSQRTGQRTTHTARMLSKATIEDVEQACRELHAQLEQQRASSAQGAPETQVGTTPLDRVKAALQACLRAQRIERRALLRKNQLEAWARAVKAWRKKYALQPRWGHRDIAARSEEAPHGIELLKNQQTGTLTSDPQEMLRILAEQRGKTAKAGPEGKQGGFKTGPPELQPRGYCWEDPDAEDRYTIATRAAPAGHREDLLERVADYGRFERILRRAANNKEPGPDGIPNELLKSLPSTAHKGVHQLMVVMWLKQDTPAAWKSSHTVMLYKKGDPTNPANYRPIGLALTVYKLWTALLTDVLSFHARELGVINDCQHGFTPGRSTHLQLMTMLNALEDAKHNSQDIYCLYIDFTSAFDMVAHDKLLQLMWDQGFPWHAVRAVESLYTGASTLIRTRFGDSDPISIDRGTLQGDTLSPFLFLLFITPLLRWLHVGQRGYQYGCLPAEEKAKHSCSAPAYADDLAIVTNTLPNLRRQTEKVSRFLKWSGLEVNHSKCGVTGMLYRRSEGHPLAKTNIAWLRRQLQGQVWIGQNTVPFLHPHDEPYRYLGVLLTPSLNWSHQRAALVDTVIEKADGILRSMASDEQKLRLIDTLLRPHIRYSLCTGAYNSADIACLDGLLTRLAKYALRLPTSTPTALVQEDRHRGGLGVTSLQETYVTELVAKLTDAINADGGLGRVTQCLLEQQIRQVGSMLDSSLAQSLRHSRLLCTVTLLALSGGTLMKYTADGAQECIQLQGNQLTALVQQLKHDPHELGVSQKLAAARFLPLIEAGVTTPGQLLDAGGRHVVAASCLEKHLRMHGIQVENRRALRVALNKLTICLNTPPELGAPHDVGGIGPADLPKWRREVRATHLVGDLQALREDTAVGGMYPDGQRTMPSYYRRAHNAAGTAAGAAVPGGGEAPVDAREPGAEQDDAPEPAAQTAASQNDAEPAGQRRKGAGAQRRRRQAAAANPAYALRQGGGTMLDFLREFKKEYDASSEKQRKYAAHPPPWDAPGSLRGPGISKKLWAWCRYHCEEPKVAIHLYNDQDRVVAFTGRAQRSGTTQRNKKSRQEMWEVQWAPTIIHRRHLPMYADLGYHPVCVRPCRRWGAGPAKFMIEVHWERKYEEVNHIASTLSRAELAALKAAYEERMAAQATEAAARRAAGPRTVEQRLTEQGVTTQPPSRWPMSPSARSLIDISAEAVHPEMDVVPPPGATGPFICVTPACITQGAEAHVYERDGKWVGSLTGARASQLRERFEAAQASRPELFAKLRAGTFEAELAALLRRWKLNQEALKRADLQRRHGVAPGALVRALSAATGTATELFASPLNVHPSMHTYFSTHERDQLFGAELDAYSRRWAGACFAHPAEVEQEMEKAVRWALASAREADSHTPVLTTLLLPDSQSGSPTYARWLAYPEVHELAYFPGNGESVLKGEPADGWKPCAEPGSGRNYSDGCHLVAICNGAGQQPLEGLYRDPAWRVLPASLAGSMAAATAQLPWPWALANRPGRPDIGNLQYLREAVAAAKQKHTAAFTQLARELQAGYKPPGALVRMPEHKTTQHAWSMPAEWHFADHRGTAFAAGYAALYAPRYDWRQAFFTDGSVQETEHGTLIGAAVWTDGAGACRINVNGTGPTNTITRAEAAAIYHAVHGMMGATEEGWLFTDSLAVIHLIRRALQDPDGVATTLHGGLLLDIARCLVERANTGVATHILKVKAHSGVAGNEEADAAAKSAAEPDAEHRFTTPAHTPFGGRVCPGFYEPPIGCGCSSGSATSQGPACLRAVTHHGKALSKRLHRRNKTGYSQMGWQATQTAQMYDGLEGDYALGKESNSYFDLPPQVVRMARKHQFGVFWDRGKAYRRWAPYFLGVLGAPAAWDGRCLLCGGEDSGGHTLLRCEHPEIKARIIARHNNTVKMTLKALQRASADGGIFTIMDACSEDEAGEYGVEGTRLPRWLLSPERVDDMLLRKLRPDILRIVGLPPNPTEEQIAHALAHKQDYRVQVIEVGYCSDTKWRATIKRKLEQHKELLQLIRDEGWHVDETAHVTVIGARGAVYASGLEALRRLGLQDQDVRLLLVEISHASCLSAAAAGAGVCAAERPADAEREGRLFVLNRLP